jgi:hypothetical protein
MRRWLLIGLVLSPAATGAHQDMAQPAGLELRIDQPGSTDPGGCYLDARKIPIQVIVMNRSTTTLDLLLRDHDDSGYHQAVLSGLQARLLDASGEVLTRHSTAKGGPDQEWWTSAYLDSTACVGDKDCEQPGDRVSIPPGQQVRRVIDLTSLLAGGPSLAGRLRTGAYRLTLRLGNLVSNEFQFVLTGGKSCDERRAP